MNKQALALIGLFLAVFGALILLTNPLNLQNFPQNIASSSWFGLILLVLGILGLYYGLKD